MNPIIHREDAGEHRIATWQPTTNNTKETNMSEYNGWHNYETWAVKLWIDNEEPSYNAWRERTALLWADEERTFSPYMSRSECARIALADDLKEYHEEVMPEVPGVWSDLLTAALSEVDWFEIADAMLTDAELDGYMPRPSTATA